MNNCTRITDKNFQSEVIDSPVPVLVDFWGSWCPPCKIMEPVIEQLAQRMDGQVKIGKLNVDQHPSFRSIYRISGVPAFALFVNGRIVRRAVGAHSLTQLLDLIHAGLAEGIPARPIVEVLSTRETSGRGTAAFSGEDKRP
jgi:thioredoxin 1